MKTDPTFWLLARASGLTAYGLLTTSVLAGLVLKSKPFGRALKPASSIPTPKPTTVPQQRKRANGGMALYNSAPRQKIAVPSKRKRRSPSFAVNRPVLKDAMRYPITEAKKSQENVTAST